MSNVKDLTGMKFGRLTVVSRDESTVGSGKIKWNCVCDCGNTLSVLTHSLVSGNTKSCGCLQREIAGNLHRTHGETQKTRLYNIWSNMKERCYGINCKDYPDYGGRGIKLCDEWRCNYLSFKSWALKNGYDDSLSIDRIDVNGDYSPENCRWATVHMQANNKRNSRIIECCGQSHTLSEWAAITGVSVSTLFCRLNKMSAEEALKTNLGKI